MCQLPSRLPFLSRHTFLLCLPHLNSLSGSHHHFEDLSILSLGGPALSYSSSTPASSPMSYLSYTLPRDPIPKPFVVGDCLSSVIFSAFADTHRTDLYRRIRRHCSHSCVAHSSPEFVHLVSLFDVFPYVSLSHTHDTRLLFSLELFLPNTMSLSHTTSLRLLLGCLLFLFFFFTSSSISCPPLNQYKTAQKLSFSNAPPKSKSYPFPSPLTSLPASSPFTTFTVLTRLFLGHGFTIRSSVCLSVMPLLLYH
jgi:hypothetical protein